MNYSAMYIMLGFFWFLRENHLFEIDEKGNKVCCYASIT